jgi:LysM repeat protein
MSLPINVKFEVPKHKAPAPTKTSLWPALKPAPAGPAEKTDAGKSRSPITTGSPMQYKAMDGRPRSRGMFQGRKRLMKFAVSVIPMLALAAVLGLGCSNEKPKPVTSALDVGGPAAAPAPQPVEPRTPAALGSPTRKATASANRATVQPPVEAVAAEPVVPTKPAAQSYVVQKGDTLFGIAKSQYGDGNKWKKIADANPGLSPNTLKVGQKIAIPPM